MTAWPGGWLHCTTERCCCCDRLAVLLLQEGYEAIVDSLASTPVDWVLAADCCYIDNVGRGSHAHLAITCLVLF